MTAINKNQISLKLLVDLYSIGFNNFFSMCSVIRTSVHSLFLSKLISFGLAFNWSRCGVILFKETMRLGPSRVAIATKFVPKKIIARK